MKETKSHGQRPRNGYAQQAARSSRPEHNRTYTFGRAIGLQFFTPPAAIPGGEGIGVLLLNLSLGLLLRASGALTALCAVSTARKRSMRQNLGASER
jgi:hypothetical protein